MTNETLLLGVAATSVPVIYLMDAVPRYQVSSRCVAYYAAIPVSYCIFVRLSVRVFVLHGPKLEKSENKPKLMRTFPGGGIIGFQLKR